jgi:hypothetical protein
MPTGILMDKYRYGPPLAADFGTLHNAGLANPVLTDTVGSGLVMDFGAGSISNNSYYTKAATKAKASGNHSVIARVQFAGLYNFMRAGLIFSDGTKLVSFAFGPTTAVGFGICLDSWNNFTGSNNSADVSNFPISPMCEWLRVDIVSNSPKDFYVSHNGRDWFKVWDTNFSGFLTVSEVGLTVSVDRAGSSSFPIALTEQLSMSCLYYKDGDIDPGF